MTASRKELRTRIHYVEEDISHSRVLLDDNELSWEAIEDL